MTSIRFLKILTGTNIVLGLWLVAVPFVYDVATSAAMWNAVVMGLIIAAVAGFDFELLREGGPASRGGAWTNAVLGLWVLAAPFVVVTELGVTGGALANHVLVGLIVAAASVYVAVMGTSERLIESR